MSFVINPYNTGCPQAAIDFIVAAGITDNTQKQAVCQLVKDLQTYGIWSKMKAIYPFVGGTATTHSYNLKNTSQYQITWNGGITHSSNGVLGNGVNGYGNTGLVPNSVLSLNSTHLSYYSRTNGGALQSEIGSNNLGVNRLQITINYSLINYNAVNNGVSTFSVTFPNNTGLFIANRNSSTQIKSFRNNTIINTQTISSDALNSFAISILAVNEAGALNQYNSKQCAFASIGDGLTDTEAANLYTAVQAYQTTLGRQV